MEMNEGEFGFMPPQPRLNRRAVQLDMERIGRQEARADDPNAADVLFVRRTVIATREQRHFVSDAHQSRRDVLNIVTNAFLRRIGRGEDDQYPHGLTRKSDNWTDNRPEYFPCSIAFDRPSKSRRVANVLGDFGDVAGMQQLPAFNKLGINRKQTPPREE